MKFLRFISYFSQLCVLLGFKAASVFALAYVKNRKNPPRDGELANIPVGKYVFYFPSFPYFEGLFTEIFLKESYVLAYTEEPIKVIDCGANIGMSLFYIKTRAPVARVLCFEPNPDARAVLEKNIAVNNWGTDVKVLPYALGKEKGTAKFFVEDGAETSSGGSVANYLEKNGRVPNSYTVDVDVLSHYINNKVDFLKIDIEGPELDVLEELAVQNKLHFISAIQLEYHYIPGFFTRPLSDMLALLESNGFRAVAKPTAKTPHVTENDTVYTYMVFANKSC